ncbi:MAG: hypothetical protein ABIT91_25655 [Gemmatimonadaceae bacterium]
MRRSRARSACVALVALASGCVTSQTTLTQHCAGGSAPLRGRVVVGMRTWCRGRATPALSARREGWRASTRELVGLAAGRTMLFHRGGWGFLGDDPASAVHFGHMLASDVDTVGVMYVKADTVRRVPGHWVAAPTRPWTGQG